MRARRRVLAYFAVAVAVAVAACSSTAPNWSFAPVQSGAPASPAASSGGPSTAATAAPSAPAAASAAATAAPSAPASGAPGASPPASPAATAGASGPAGGSTVLDVTAQNITFTQASFTVAAGTPFTIHFANQDAGVPHDVAVDQGSAGGQQLFQGQIVTGVATADYQVPALAPGTYTLICTVHPTQMHATLTVK